MTGTRKADVLATDLLRKIVSGEITVGSLLPKEAQLAEHYGVNRSVVREGIKLLEVHRLVRPRRRRGTEVLDPLTSLSPEVIEAMLMPEPGRLDASVLADFLEVRAGLDHQMSVMAAKRRTDADLTALCACVDAIEAAMDDLARYDEEVDRFVRLVARASHNRLFEMMANWNQRIAERLREVFRVSRPVGRPHVEALRILVAMIEAGRAEELGVVVDAYHEWAIPRMLAAAALRGGAPLDEITSPRGS